MTLTKKVLVLVALAIMGSVIVTFVKGKRESGYRNAEVITSLQAYVDRHQADATAEKRVEVAQVLIDCQKSWNASVEKCGKELVDRYGQDIVGYLTAINAAGGFGQASLPGRDQAPQAMQQQPAPAQVAGHDPHGYRIGDGQNER